MCVCVMHAQCTMGIAMVTTVAECATCIMHVCITHSGIINISMAATADSLGMYTDTS